MRSVTARLALRLAVLGHAGASTQVDLELARLRGHGAESSLSAQSHPIGMSGDEMAVAEGRFSPAPIRGRLQGDLSGVGPAQETAGAPRGPAGGPCAVNWIRVRWASLGENSRARRTGLSWGQQCRRPSPHVLTGGPLRLGLHVLSNSQVPRTEFYEAQAERL